MASVFGFVLFFVVCLSYLTPSTHAYSEYIPITYKINQKQTECLYDQFEQNDFVTFSAFVVEALNNGIPSANIKFEGPVANNQEVLEKINDKGGGNTKTKNNDDLNSLGRELRTGAFVHWPKVKDSDKAVRYDKRIGIINRSLKVDWTHAGESEDAMASRAQIEREKKEAYRNYGRGPQNRDGDAADQKNEQFRTITQVKIEPFEETHTIKASGWYRLCISSEYHGLMVEMEMRSGTKLGGVDRTTGHVYTYEEREMLDEEKRIDEDISATEESLLDANTYASFKEEVQKEIENQVKEQDMHATQTQVKHLNVMVTEMKKQNQDSHRRIKSHEATARRNYENLAWSGKLETLLYILISGVQVYTIRKWLSGNSVLGN